MAPKRTVVQTAAVEQHENRLAHLREQHKAIEDALDAQRPQPVEITQNDTNKPKLFAGGVVVMPGDYYYKDNGNYVVISSVAVESGEWSEAQ